MAAVWPYYPFVRLLGRTGGFDDVHRPLYVNALSYFGLAIVTLPALWLRWRRDRRDPLVVLFLLSAAVVAAGGIGDGRVAHIRPRWQQQPGSGKVRIVCRYPASSRSYSEIMYGKSAS